MDWCARDGQLMATAGKDEYIIFQNPNSGQLLGKIHIKGNVLLEFSLFSLIFYGFLHYNDEQS